MKREKDEMKKHYKQMNTSMTDKSEKEKGVKNISVRERKKNIEKER